MAEYGKYGSVQCLGEILVGKQGKGACNIVYNQECHQKDVASDKQQVQSSRCVVVTA